MLDHKVLLGDGEESSAGVCVGGRNSRRLATAVALVAIGVLAALFFADRDVTGAIRIIGESDFPANLNCRIIPGNPSNPTIELRADGQVVTKTRICTDSFISEGGSPCVSLLRVEGSDRWVLYLFCSEGEGSVGYFDLDSNGTWDAKRIAGFPAKIRLANTWKQVDQLRGLATAYPTCEIDSRIFFFDERWKAEDAPLKETLP